MYLQLDAERTHSAADLLSRIAYLQVEHVVNLGYGLGNSTRLLRTVWPLAVVTGIDNPPAMLAQAVQALPDYELISADIARWQPVQPMDMIYTNAFLQWLADHEMLFPRLVAQLAANGTLAAQMSDNRQESLHTLMRQVADEQGLPDRGRQSLLPPDAWHDILTRQGYEVDIWHTTYFHPLAPHQAISDWSQGIGLRPYLAGLDEQSGNAFLTRYVELLAERYLLQCNGEVLLQSPKLFIVTRRTNVQPERTFKRGDEQEEQGEKSSCLSGQNILNIVIFNLFPDMRQ